MMSIRLNYYNQKNISKIEELLRLEFCYQCKLKRNKLVEKEALIKLKAFFAQKQIQ